MPLQGSLPSVNGVSVLLFALVALSVIQGMRRGASVSARHLLFLVIDGINQLACLAAAWIGAKGLSPLLRDRLVGWDLTLGDAEGDPNRLEQVVYGVMTSLRDFPLLRFGLLMLVLYAVASLVFGKLFYAFAAAVFHPRQTGDKGSRLSGVTSSALGGGFGAMIGVGRAAVAVLILFLFASVYPNSSFTAYMQESEWYRLTSEQVIRPWGSSAAERLPVFTKQVQKEFAGILQRKYEIIDYKIPKDIAGAAKEITAGQTSVRDKAYALYRWIGTRISYDYQKAELYETKKVWKEQTPKDTFDTRKGVCIDYSRLYAVMARSVGLKAEVVTGMGSDGRGGFGPHAWNEVYLPADDRWIPLDSTWVESGGNWFDPEDFDKSHIKDR